MILIFCHNPPSSIVDYLFIDGPLKQTFGKRETLCINYLVDEDHLRIPQESYFTAVQIIRMIPLLESSLGQKMLVANAWVFEHLPNAARNLHYRDEYIIGKGGAPSTANAIRNGLLKRINHKIYRGYHKKAESQIPGRIRSRHCPSRRSR